MKKIIQFIGLAIVAVGIVGILTDGQAFAATADVIKQSCQQQGQADTPLCDQDSTQLFGANSFWTRIINALLFVTAALSVLMIVIGGFRYVVSGGDQGAVTSAKNTILYSIIGLIVSFAGYAIVNFVLSEVL